jgi:hypothetical protein
MKKIVKAKDCYGPVLDRVKQNNIAKVQEENDTADPPPPGGNILHCTHTIDIKIRIIILTYILLILHFR